MSTVITVRNKDGSEDYAIRQFAKLDIVERENDVSSWSLEAPLSDATIALGTPGASIVIERNDRVLISGPMTQPYRYWSSQTDHIVISGLSDDVYLWDRLVYPCAPNLMSVTNTPFDTAEYDVRTGAGETVIRQYVAANAGGGTFSTGSQSGRAVSGLTQSADQGTGSVITGRGRFQILGDLLQQLAVAAGGLRFGITALQFWVKSARDISTDIEFSREMRNVLSIEYRRKAPTATHLVVAGSGEGTARTAFLDGDTVASGNWRRVESFRDRRDTADLSELMQTMSEELVNNAESAGLKLVPRDLPYLTYGADYERGDIVAAVIDGARIVDQLRQVEITLDQNGYTVAPSIESASTSGAASVLRVFDKWREFERRLNHLERTL